MDPTLSIARRLTCLYVILFYIACISCSIHHLELKDDYRPFVKLSHFGYLNRGSLHVNVHNFTSHSLEDKSDNDDDKPSIGFMLIKARRYDELPSHETISKSKECPFHGKCTFGHSLLSMTLNKKEKVVKLNCVENELQPTIELLEGKPSERNIIKRDTIQTSPVDSDAKSNLLPYDKALNNASSTSNPRSKVIQFSSNTSAIQQPELRKSEKSYCFRQKCPKSSLSMEVYSGLKSTYYSFNFSMHITSDDQEGIYLFAIYNCNGDIDSFRRDKMKFLSPFNINVTIHEINYPHNYLSAGEIPLPQLCFMFSVMFFMASAVWINFLHGVKHSVVKIHHLMSWLVILKAFALLFHAINYHYISLKGSPDVVWAYLFYATRAMKGALFFITLALIGSGWTLIRHILSDKDKKIILVMVLMQIFAYLAETIIDETSEGAISLEFWIKVFRCVDLLCCLITLYPISWSIRHLTEASKTDGKAAINLKKLELFKKFYIITSVYMYATRIVTLFLAFFLTFNYHWMAMCFYELATLAYFIVTGYYFQPLPSNPYTLVASDLDLDEEVVFSLGDTDHY